LFPLKIKALESQTPLQAVAESARVMENPSKGKAMLAKTSVLFFGQSLKANWSWIP
jgi:hypothetical protein